MSYSVMKRANEWGPEYASRDAEADVQIQRPGGRSALCLREFGGTCGKRSNPTGGGVKMDNPQYCIHSTYPVSKIKKKACFTNYRKSLKILINNGH